MNGLVAVNPATGGGRRRALVVVNANARNGSRALDDIFAMLREGGLDLKVESCSKERPLERIIGEAGEWADCVVVGGGDGTINAAAPALRKLGKPFGILPLGTANDLARTLGIGPDLAQAARVILKEEPHPIDLGSVNGHLYFNVASIGFSAYLAKAMSKRGKKVWGKLAYPLTAARLLVRMRPFTATIEHDGRTDTVKTVQVSVGNGRHYGGGLTVDARAEPDDGRLDLYSLEIRHWWQMLALVPALRRGTQGRFKDVRLVSTTACTVRTRKPRPINADGELVGDTPAAFEVLPAALRVYAPADRAAARSRATLFTMAKT